MGCCSSSEIKYNNAQLMTELEVEYNEEVEYKLDHRTSERNKIKKLLLLGSGSSGKSTLFRQLKCLYSTGFQPADIKEATPMIRKNCVTGILKLLQKTQQLYDTDEKENSDCFINLNKINANVLDAIETVVRLSDQRFEMFGGGSSSGSSAGAGGDSKNNNNNNHCRLTDEQEMNEQYLKREMNELKEAIKLLWDLSQIQATFHKRRRFLYSFPDNMQYFFQEVERIFEWDFVPTVDDIINCRIRTTGIIEERYDQKKITFTITDVGGQRNERKKWIHSFEAVTAVIFVCALNHYACVLFEDEDKNGMIESIEVFTEICNSKWFKRSEIILFLNKNDLFSECIKQDIPLSLCFNEENGCVMKEEYINDKNYWPKSKIGKKSNSRRFDSDWSASLGCRYDDAGNISAPYVPPKAMNVGNMSDLELDAYRKSCAIYIKQQLRYSEKDTYNNGQWKDSHISEWYNYIYRDYLYFISEQYLSKNSRPKFKQIFVHVTTAVNQNNVETVFWNVQHIVIKSNLSHGGMLLR